MITQTIKFGTCLCLFLSVCVECFRGGAVQFDDSPQARKIFLKADVNNDGRLTLDEFHHVFLQFDKNGDRGVTSHEFLEKWQADNIGTVEQGIVLYFNLDVNDDNIINEAIDTPSVFRFFDRDYNEEISEGEFVLQWAKISS